MALPSMDLRVTKKNSPNPLVMKRCGGSVYESTDGKYRIQGVPVDSENTKWTATVIETGEVLGETLTLKDGKVLVINHMNEGKVEK